MISEIKVPVVGESITEGVIAAWKKKDGDYIRQDDDLFELETDKITMTVQSTTEGVLRIKAKEGSTALIGQVVATVDGSAKHGESAARSTTEPESKPESGGDGRDAGPPISAPAGIPQMREKLAAAGASEPSPAVRKLIAEHDLDAGAIPATGRAGRLTKADVVKFIQNKEEVRTPAAKESEEVTPAAPSSKEGGQGRAPSIKGRVERLPSTERMEGKIAGERQTRKPMSRLRQRVAERMVAAQHGAAMLTTFNEADMTRVIELRKRFKEGFERHYGGGLGFMSFFVKASIDALKFVPEVNAQIDGDEIVQNHFYDIGVAVSIERGLVVPVIRDADRLSFSAIEQTIAALADKAHNGTLTIDDLTGGVFTISNGGVFGSLLSTPILNPPQSAILGMHAIRKRAMVTADDRIEVRPMMYLALSYDHRLIDGREAVTFLKRIVECVEYPERMLLGV